jgi:MFS transporter, DHA3 family, macrolide efflux protein
MLPVFRPLTDRAVLTVWSGLCTSTIGEDLFRVASVWLAVEVAGNMAGLVTGVQYVAMLVAGLFGGVLFDRWRPDRAMIGSRAGVPPSPCCRSSASTSRACRSPC